jgi:hypothetical protein
MENKLVAVPYLAISGRCFIAPIFCASMDITRHLRPGMSSRPWRVGSRGERAKGNKNFWGFVWQGAAAEALTCTKGDWCSSDQWP